MMKRKKPSRPLATELIAVLFRHLNGAAYYANADYLSARLAGAGYPRPYQCCSVSQTLAADTLQSDGAALAIVKAIGNAVIIAKLVFSTVAVKCCPRDPEDRGCHG
jgi:hypothetical protein